MFIDLSVPNLRTPLGVPCPFMKLFFLNFNRARHGRRFFQVCSRNIALLKECLLHNRSRSINIALLRSETEEL